MEAQTDNRLIEGVRPLKIAQPSSVSVNYTLKQDVMGQFSLWFCFWFNQTAFFQPWTTSHQWYQNWQKSTQGRWMPLWNLSQELSSFGWSFDNWQFFSMLHWWVPISCQRKDIELCNELTKSAATELPLPFFLSFSNNNSLPCQCYPVSTTNSHITKSPGN